MCFNIFRLRIASSKSFHSKSYQTLDSFYLTSISSHLCSFSLKFLDQCSWSTLVHNLSSLFLPLFNFLKFLLCLDWASRTNEYEKFHMISSFNFEANSHHLQHQTLKQHRIHYQKENGLLVFLKSSCRIFSFG